MKKIIILFVFLMVLSACAPDTAEPPGIAPEPSTTIGIESSPAFVWTAENFPRLDGSTATIPLGQGLAAALLGLPRAECEGYAMFTKTDNAYRALFGGSADLLLVYEGEPELMEQARSSDYECTAIGRDALVFLVNVENGVENITTEQLRGIYTGEITNWLQVGGADVEILAYQRPDQSGSQVMMEKLVMQGVDMIPAATHLVVGDMGGLVDVVAAYDNAQSAIGYNVYYYVSQMKRDPRVRILSIDGVAPTAETIGSGQYPFCNEFYAIIQKQPSRETPAARLFDWLTGEHGRRLMEYEGYVPVF